MPCRRSATSETSTEISALQACASPRNRPGRPGREAPPTLRGTHCVSLLVPPPGLWREPQPADSRAMCPSAVPASCSTAGRWWPPRSILGRRSACGQQTPLSAPAAGSSPARAATHAKEPRPGRGLTSRTAGWHLLPAVSRRDRPAREPGDGGGSKPARRRAVSPCSVRRGGKRKQTGDHQRGVLLLSLVPCDGEGNFCG